MRRPYLASLAAAAAGLLAACAGTPAAQDLQQRQAAYVAVAGADDIYDDWRRTSCGGDRWASQSVLRI